ncbi:aminopeptidase [Weissella muntiaci]|uniref:Aminopeptidase n=1 Tax=Weissella muntiaci TaxID=2508881 RepID=A0A6C2C305_9LACO|nr:aminopeptidase [Weissella muntiaci]TYC48099.1 aminopeptidase [Weissella muntiaci]
MLNNLDALLKRYAKVITSIGINVQYGQDVIIYAQIDQSPLVHHIQDAAYDLGANNVMVEWQDTHTARGFLNHAREQDLIDQPAWLTIRAEELMGRSTSRISIISEDPDGFADVDPDRVSTYQQSYQRAVKAVREATMNNDVAWLVVGAAGKEWSQKVFPELEPEQAQARLWAEIFKTTRIDLDHDPIQAWEQHIAELKEKADWLNRQNFKALQYKSAVTDLTVGLAENHLWEAADSVSKAGNLFVANMPTEEVFTSPDARHISGHVRATKPLSYSGVLINDIDLTFDEGKVTAAHASTGDAVLQQLLATDAGARSLGEVSLVPDPSPISQSGIIFYNTLFDENASDHLALGAAYPFNVKNGTQLSAQKRAELGQNDSLIHVDFMMGSADMNIDGLTHDGQTIPVFRNGDWA